MKIRKLLLSSAALAIAGTGAVQAQQAAPETVVVTGTSIRGTQPPGSSLITVDRATIEDTGAQTVQQLLTNIPSVAGFGGNPQGTQGGITGVPASVGIHGVGNGSSTATLVLLDGHRFAGDTATNIPDPNFIPNIALQRVDVLPDGASSIYGSDAVSGVINFITRKNFTGVETSAQYGIADKYNSFDAAAVAGYAWDGGSLLAAYEYSSQSDLMSSARDFVTSRQDIRRGKANPSDFVNLPPQAAGLMQTTLPSSAGTTEPGGLAIPYPSYGVNSQNFNCPVATIATSSSANAYYYTAAGDYNPAQNPNGAGWSVSTTNQPSQGLCDANAYSALLPSATNNSWLLGVHQQIGNDVTVSAQIVYGTHLSFNPQSRGSVSATVFGPGAATAATGSAAKLAATAGEINPYYVGNSVTGTTSEFVRYDLNPLLGPGAGQKAITNVIATSADLSWDLGGDREITVGGVYSLDTQIGHQFGTVNAAEGFLALNGTVTAGGAPQSGALPDPLGLNTVQGVLSRVLTTLNALDVWNPAATNRTSPQVIAALRNNSFDSVAASQIADINAKFDGPVFDLPAGAVKVAVGGEFERIGMDETGSLQLTGPNQSNANGYNYRNGRQIWSGFLEINAPLISEEMNIPLVMSLSIDASGRYDHYSGFGDTENPKVGLDWKIVDGIKARASYGTSFVAPGLHDSAPHNFQDAVSSSNASLNTTNTIPFNTTLGYNGGAGIAGTWVATPSTCTAGGGQLVASDGVTLLPAGSANAFGCKLSFANTQAPNTSLAYSETGGNTNLRPARGRNTSVGLDLDFGKIVPFLEGLTTNVTYYDFLYHGLITSQSTLTFLPQLTSFAPPGGWTITSPAVVNFIGGKVVNVRTDIPIWALSDGRLQNAYNIWQNGLDYQINYSFGTDSWGDFRFGVQGNEMLRYSTQGGNTGAVINTKDGHNSPRYPSAEMQFQVRAGWTFSGFSTNWSLNFISPTAYNVSNFPYNLSDATGTRGYLVGNPGVFTSSGTAHLGALSTVNVTNTYTIPQGFAGMPDIVTSGTSISLGIQNLFNQLPPYAAGGANPTNNGNIVMRQINLGIRKNF